MAPARLAVVCPMANEAGTARALVGDVLARCDAAGFPDAAFLAILDHASRDGTRALLEAHAAAEPRLRVIWAPEDRGVVDAYVRGYREALAAGADWILEMDAGYSHRPEDIPRFLALARAGCDCVFATRFARGGRYAGGIGRRFLVSWLGSWLARLALGVPGTDLTSGFRLFSRAALARVVDAGVRSRGPFFQTEIRYRLRDARVAEVPITYAPSGQVPRGAALRDALGMLAALFLERLRRGLGWPA